MKKILYVLVTVSVTGCLLTQNDPAPVEKKPFLEGKVVVEDMIISNQGQLSVLNAGFKIRPENQSSAPKPVGARLATLEGRFQATSDLLRTDPGRGPECQKAKIAKKPNQPTDKPEAPVDEGWIGVGKIGFGPALQPNLQILEENSQKRYQAVLRLGIADGAYQLVNDGTPKTPAFREVLSMPEKLSHLRLNGKDFGDPTMEFQPAKDLDLFWREPSIPNDRNGIMMEIMVEDADSIYDVFCAKYESDIPAADFHKKWTLDDAWFAEFPRTGTATFIFVRTHLIDSVAPESEILLQGRRTFYSRLPAMP